MDANDLRTGRGRSKQGWHCPQMAAGTAHIRHVAGPERASSSTAAETMRG
jgi:hypothetical protein